MPRMPRIPRIPRMPRMPRMRNLRRFQKVEASPAAPAATVHHWRSVEPILRQRLRHCPRISSAFCLTPRHGKAKKHTTNIYKHHKTSIYTTQSIKFLAYFRWAVFFFASNDQVRHRLEWLQPCPMTLRAFLCLSGLALFQTHLDPFGIIPKFRFFI